MPSKVLPLLEPSMVTVFTWLWISGVADENRNRKKNQLRNLRGINLRGQVIKNDYSLGALFASRSV
jgi:hypothetical protein